MPRLSVTEALIKNSGLTKKLFKKGKNIMMKTFLKGLAGILLPPFAAWIASGYEKPLITIGVLVIGYLISAIFFRATVLMFIGARVYGKNRRRGLTVFGWAYKTRKLHPNHQLLYGYILLRNGKLDDAENVINKALVLGKHVLKDADIKASEFNRALITWKRGDLNAAIVELENLYEEGYKTSGLYDSLASLYLLNKEYEEAAKIAAEGVEYSEKDLVSRDNLGQAYIELGRIDEAEKIYEELIPQNPQFLEAYYNYATILERRGEMADARKYYGIALTIEEKFLSIISHDQVCEALDRVNELMI